MAVLSKHLGALGFRILSYNCYELAHTWNPSCWGATWDVTKAAFVDSFKIYATLYLITAAMKRPKLKDFDWQRLLKDILRSTLFLTTNGALFIGSLCVIRYMMGVFTVPNFGFTNGLVASFCAILIEQKRRRGMLALYLTNLASEVAFNMLKHRKYIKPLPYGEVLIFAMALSGYMYFLRKGTLDESIASALRMVFDISPSRNRASSEAEGLTAGKHPLCSHQGSCIESIPRKFLRNFLPSFGALSAIRLVTSIKKILRGDVMAVFKDILSPAALKLPLFIGCMPAIYSGSQCLLHRKLNVDNPATAALSGFLAGGALLWKPNATISLYVAWKLIEVLYFKGVERKMLPKWKHGDILVYTLSTAFVLFGAAVEPHTIRPGYWGFLKSLTGDHFCDVNRPALDQFGFASSKAFPGQTFDLNPRYTSINPAFIPTA